MTLLRLLRLLLLPLVLAAGPALAAEDELLEPEQAFRFSARPLDAARVEVRFLIADGYYLYRDRLRFEAEPATVALGRPDLPAGKMKDDEIFGRVETYRGDLRVALPVSASAEARRFTLKVTSQGCADVGVCYTPRQDRAELSLIASAAAAEPPKSSAAPSSGRGLLDSLKGLGGGLGASDDEVLPPEQAFTVNVSVRDGATVVADFRPEKGYYLYRDKLAFALANLPGAAIAGVALPAGEMKEDPQFGKTEVYRKPFQVVLTLKREGAAEAKGVLNATWQGCKEKSVCYPPISRGFDILLPTAQAAAPGATPPSPAGAARSAPESESDRYSGLLKHGNFWLLLTGFFGAGLLLTFTPCVLPMVPILSGIIVGHGAHANRGRALALSAAYVLGMAITYTAAGIAAGLSGTLLTNALQNPWVLASFAAVFVALAFSMFGFYELQLPAAMQSRLSETANRLPGGRYAGVFGMGVLSALIVGPCVAAPLAGALLYIGKTGDWVLGGSGLFAMALGMGVPLLAVGVSAGTLMPRAGPWMNSVKQFFGVLLLGLAIWLVSPVIPPVIHMLAWAALLIVSAIYLHAIDPLPPGASGLRKFWKGVGLIALLTGVAILVGALSGGRDVLQPLSALRIASAGTGGEAPHLKFERVHSVAELESRVAQAAGRYVMLDFYADWCVSCKEMERFTFSDPRIQAKLRDVVLLQADVTASTPEDLALLKRFGLFGPPGILFFDRQGREVPDVRVIGYLEPERFLKTLEGTLI
ncbi:MAG TPA: protein-disulfide reductase DsbD [Burkholderiales bacterium]|nr:protein-disulfide reductase DsbD [Burkholderiales bacterium]